jgi:hypothetical protein
MRRETVCPHALRKHFKHPPGVPFIREADDEVVRARAIFQTMTLLANRTSATVFLLLSGM